MVRVGPAGWLYKDWDGIVYPEPKPKGFDPLTFIAGFFDVVEVNSTFYGPATRKTARQWARRVEENPRFRFTGKLWKRFTHERKKAWTRAEARQARGGFDVLQREGRLGAVLMQFPWSFRNEEENREWLTDVVGELEGLPLVVEVRHSSWMEAGFLEELIEKGVGFVNIDQPLYANSIEATSHVTSPVGYVRVHGRNYQKWWRNQAPHERYDYLYTPAQLEPWVKRVKEIAEETEDTFVVLNNHYRGQAPANALMVKSMLEKKKMPAPQPLLEHFEEELRPYAKKARSRKAD